MYRKPVYSNQCPSIYVNYSELNAILDRMYKLASHIMPISGLASWIMLTFGNGYNAIILMDQSGVMYMVNLYRHNTQIRHYTTIA